ncbi:hypothetical protein TcasGA2_TC010424 [Tribolium castaneum]|uniref:MARVEL domain-containing protein n=1 Tax=Tribolium castaneum TaxID=7070 RepID=D6WKN6_TRICA|nr:PREDICTED: uncharacterized protein LOC103314923 [Tribolium castaneum]EFA03001.1 hypothetical protein TcasGA2_TC010424 [Tribolium castaneum]|eukprot:XP_008200446.1 PREDICTED: uncharacterized protein LOC103314923 [Tribolium castaneum]
MDSNVVPVIGWQYLWTYAGGLNIIEELLDITIIIFMAFSGYSTKAHIFTFVVALASIYTIIFTALHIRGVIRRSRLPWYWIECIAVLIVAVAIVGVSSLVMMDFTRGYVITGIMGYVTAGVYFVDTFERYKVAITPAPKYAWTVPNMPDLE